MKKVLLVYQENFFEGRHGTNGWVLEIARFFKELGFSIDQMGFDNLTASNVFVDFDRQNGLHGSPVDNLYVYDYSKDNEPVPSLAFRVKRKLKRMADGTPAPLLQDWTRGGMYKLFKEITAANDYDVIIVFYTYFANLLREYEGRAKKVYFMVDNVFLQQYYWDSQKDQKGEKWIDFS